MVLKYRNTLREIYEWVESILIGLIVVLFVLTFTFRISIVEGSSMLPTLHDREYMLFSRLFYQPDYNDIVVLQAKNLVNDYGEYGKPIVKRVIGLPGDEIWIDYNEGVVYRNEEPLALEYDDSMLYEDGHWIREPTMTGEMHGTVVVPENCVFVLGDNRNNSKDSRSSQIGTVDNHYIMGKVFWRIFPLDSFGSVYAMEK